MHPALPSGHALQSMLVVDCVSRALPAGKCADLRKALRSMGDRIAENREVAGLHYPSDREASALIAPAVMTGLTRTERFQLVLEQAVKEWSHIS
jgi:acid phosphatase (class A)